MSVPIVLLTLLSCVCAVVRIGWVSPITGEFGPIVDPTEKALKLWLRTVNNNGGIVVGNVTHSVELIIVDIGDTTTARMATNIEKTVAEMCNTTGAYGQIDVMIGPYSSTLAPIAIAESAKCNLVTVIGGAAATSILRCVSNTDGSLPAGCDFEGQRKYFHVLSTIGPAKNYLGAFMSLTKIKQALTVGVFYEKASFNEEVALGAVATAENLKMNITSVTVVPRTTTVAAAANWTRALVQHFKETKPDVIIGGTYTEACYGFLLEMKAQRYTPGAAAFSVCTGPQLPLVLGVASLWSMGSSGWDARLMGNGFDESTARSAHYPYTKNSSKHSCAQFADAFDAFTGGEQPTYQAVAHYAVGYAIHELLMLSQSLSRTDLIANLLNVYVPASIYGPLVFDNVGANVGKEFITLQVFDPTQFAKQTKRTTQQTSNSSTPYQLTIVTPLVSAQQDAVYPVPQWDQRVFAWSYASQPAETAIISITSICIFVTLCVFVLFVYWRERPQIMAASYVYCCAMLFGGVLAYTSMYFWVVNTTTAWCNLIPWFILLGFDIMTGSLLAKNWRLYRIFSSSINQMRQRKPINNLQLAIPVIVLCAIDAILIIIWEAVFHIVAEVIVVDPLRPALNYIRCTSPNYTAWTAFIGTLGGLKAVVILVGIWLAIVCRKQPSEFNESKYVAYALYNQLFCICILLAIWQAIPNENYNLAYILRSIVFLWGISLTLISIFAQKIYFTCRGKKDPMKKLLGRTAVSNVQVKGQGNSSDNTSSVPEAGVNYKSKNKPSTTTGGSLA